MPTESREAPRPSGRRGPGIPLSAVILIALGILLLLQSTDVVRWELWLELWRFWPVIIIAFGVNLLLRWRAPWLAFLIVIGLLAGSVGIAFALTEVDDKSETITRLSEPLGALKAVEVSISFSQGSLTLSSLPAGSSSLVEGTFHGRRAKLALVRADGTAELSISMESRRFLRGFSDVDWDISLSRTPELDISLDGGAADMTLDLRRLKVSELDIDTGAASVEITMPSGAGHTKAQIDGGAASISITVPDGVAAEITTTSALSSLEIDGRRFPKSNGAHASPDYDTAVNRVAIHLRVGASSVSVR